MFNEHGGTIDQNEMNVGPVSLPKRPPQVNQERRVFDGIDIAAEIMSMEDSRPLAIPAKYQDRLRSNEIANSQAKYFDFFDLSDEQKSVLAADIKESRGIARIFVHPYYFLNEPRHQYELDNQDEIDQFLQRILALKRGERPPVIFQEDYTGIDNLYKYIKGFNADDVYIAPTFSEDAQPYIDGQTKYIRKDKSFQSEPYLKFNQLLKSLGVKSIIAGGISFSAGSCHGMQYGGCLGRSISNLKVDFDVSLSNASDLPRKRLPNDLRDKL